MSEMPSEKVEGWTQILHGIVFIALVHKRVKEVDGTGVQWTYLSQSHDQPLDSYKFNRGSAACNEPTYLNHMINPGIVISLIEARGSAAAQLQYLSVQASIS